MPGGVHELATRDFGNIVCRKIIPMGLYRDLKYMGCTSRSAPREAQWPSVVIECGVAEGLRQLKTDSCWWLKSSSRDVKIVLLFAIKAAFKTIRIEKWEMVRVPNALATQANPNEVARIPALTTEVDILYPVSATGSLILEFSKVFLRPPVQNTLEGDIIFSASDLEDWATDIWDATT
ncbi:hypothetical protein HOY82DRAFT_636846 [Tuber indicum]|nr:hypothetical protein HOY82DRAFT_636846 [Tuber indicum]